jgi:hypothetical protein
MARARAQSSAAASRSRSAMTSKRTGCHRNAALGAAASGLRAPASGACSVAEASSRSVQAARGVRASSAGHLAFGATGCTSARPLCRAGPATAGVPALPTAAPAAPPLRGAGPCAGTTARHLLRCPPPQAGGRGGFGGGSGGAASQGRIATEVRTPEGPIHWGCYLSRRSTLEVGRAGYFIPMPKTTKQNPRRW